MARTYKTVILTPTSVDGKLVYVPGNIKTHNKFSELPHIKSEMIKIGVQKALASQRKKHKISDLDRRY